MKYFEFTFRTQPCTETVNDVLAAILGEVGFESFVESEGGLTAYIQQALCDENTIKDAIEDHRASSNHEPRTIYGRIVSTADRTIIDIDNTIRRSYSYGKRN